jgi:Yersinia/Haemophilus virulence surface antigen
MFFIYSCPCRTLNFSNVGPLAADESLVKACRACGKTIAWVGSKEQAERRKKASLTNDPIVIDPGRKATLADAQAGVAIGSKDDVADLVVDQNCVLRDRYSQGERITQWSSQEEGVKEGVCNGQSLHWIRRVLQGGRVEYKVREHSGKSGPSGPKRSAEEIKRKERDQHMGGVIAQKATSKEALQKHSDAAYKAYKEVHDRLTSIQQRATETFAAEIVQLGGQKTPQGWSYPLNEKTKALAEKYDVVCETVSRMQRERTEAYERASAAGEYKAHWAEISQDLDKQVADALKKTQKRPFSGIVAIKCLPRVRFEGGTEPFIKKLATDDELKEGSCALVTVGLKIGVGESGGRISAHAVAIYFARQNEYYLFDPNVGVFSCSSKDVLKKALGALINDGWVKILGWQVDGEFGYSVFKAVSVPSLVTNTQLPVDYKSSPQATGTQNKGVIPASTKPPVIAVTKPVVSPPSGNRVAELMKKFE